MFLVLPLPKPPKLARRPRRVAEAGGSFKSTPRPRPDKVYCVNKETENQKLPKVVEDLGAQLESDPVATPRFLRRDWMLGAATQAGISLIRAWRPAEGVGKLAT